MVTKQKSARRQSRAVCDESMGITIKRRNAHTTTNSPSPKISARVHHCHIVCVSTRRRDHSGSHWFHLGGINQPGVLK